MTAVGIRRHVHMMFAVKVEFFDALAPGQCQTRETYWQYRLLFGHAP